jgi:hypothetical protein
VGKIKQTNNPTVSEWSHQKSPIKNQALEVNFASDSYRVPQIETDVILGSPALVSSWFSLDTLKTAAMI